MKSTTSIFLILFCFLLNISAVNAQTPKKPEDISPLLIGENIPNVSLIDSSGEPVNLATQIQKSNTVLVFYRGGWCPFCNRQLAALGASEEAIIKLGYQIIAVSPDDYKNLKPTIEKDELNYKVYADPNGELIQQMGIAFTASLKSKTNISLKTKGKTTDFLPVPAVFVVNTEGEILFEYISPNYKQRLSPELLLAVLENLN